MELQWELIIFTTLVAWSAGLFASQCVLALKGEAPKAQMPSWIAAAALLVVGGVAVFFHLEHWERIFNGFGHLTSGITQELIAVVLFAVVAVVYLVFLRKGGVPKWLAGVGIAVSAVLVVVMAHSYMMSARPAWNSLAWVLCVLGNACVMGPATMAAIVAATDKEAQGSGLLGILNVAGAAVNAVGTLAYVVAAAAVGSAFSSVGYYFDPSHPTAGMVDVSSFSPFAGDSAMLVMVAIVCALAAVAFAILGKKQSKWMLWGAAAAVCALVGAVAIRVAFYNMGASVFMFF